MASYVPPKISAEFIFYQSLSDSANPGKFKVDPTIAIGDFKVVIDGGASANLTTLPVVSPAGSSLVKFVISIAEMAGDNVVILCRDVAGAEWDDLDIPVQTTAQQIDDLNAVAPDNAGISSNGSSIAALNDFDPATDAVANVTLVGTCTTNSDMRGTDSANTVVPDNISVAAVKAKTDQFVFTKANEIDSNIKSVNGVTVTGTGATGSEWGP